MPPDASTNCNRNCDHCGDPVETPNDHITCMGFFEQTTHIRCAKFNAPFVMNIDERSNLFWMYRQCASLMNLARFKTALASIGNAITSITDSQGERFTELKRAISDHGKQMEQLSKKVTASTPLSSRPAVGQPALKRRREEHSRERKPLLGGTKALTTCPVLTVPPPKQMFWLYLSRNHPSVKSEAVMNLTKDSLQCEESIKVIPLVRKDADLTSMNFISFKVGMDVKYRDTAIDPATWPNGIAFREFEGISSTNYWAPEKRTSNPTPRIELTPASRSDQSATFLSSTSDTGATPIGST